MHPRFEELSQLTSFDSLSESDNNEYEEETRTENLATEIRETFFNVNLYVDFKKGSILYLHGSMNTYIKCFIFQLKLSGVLILNKCHIFPEHLIPLETKYFLSGINRISDSSRYSIFLCLFLG